MSTTPDVHELSADPADDLMARFQDCLEALNALRDTARDIACPGCDPSGERTGQVREEVKQRYALVFGDADFLLGCAADTRQALMGVLFPPDFFDGPDVIDPEDETD